MDGLEDVVHDLHLFFKTVVPRMVLCPGGSKGDADVPSTHPEGAAVYQATVTEVPTHLPSRLGE